MQKLLLTKSNFCSLSALSVVLLFMTGLDKLLSLRFGKSRNINRSVEEYSGMVLHPIVISMPLNKQMA